MNLNSLDKILSAHPSFRLTQAKKAVFCDLMEDWDEVTSLPKEIRGALAKDCPLEIDSAMQTSADGQTNKAAITLADGARVETVLMRYAERNTVCVSSQVGCAMGCDYCATGQMGFTRDLTADEMVEQVIFFARILKKENKRVSNVVFMGMGEPFLNYDNVMAAIDAINDKNGLNIGSRHIAISTCGIVEGIKKLADEPKQVSLAISLNAPNDSLRSELMAVNKRYPLKNILRAVDDYIAKTKRKVMFEYLMIAGVNDSIEQAKALAKIMAKPLYMVNLIPYNFTGKYKASSAAQVQKFRDVLVEAGIYTTQRKRFGRGIKAACGQLVAGLG
ncbi:23S rRNA (adenine(2503)-C(2))-methyltransferase [Candidatus Falkowbacteria bacterium RIFOXYC2_FULL_48_21]|uniref:Probable dual-specificity RNA methyltransferase RlmN n=1 Tax=Candidatus Falkowbacteria bacterium RIFOXYC2_FULL_48_21 TaxID=1798005 RepID=A0A1F5TCL7_9BACT|nr:MAG: 23S rRNA (adenine(2503)-C(2))-methyltransferase [Candidatus Falkowbacteria bacterium RIFOXYC2_FULL_48_21]